MYMANYVFKPTNKFTNCTNLLKFQNFTDIFDNFIIQMVPLPWQHHFPKQYQTIERQRNGSGMFLIH
jgi:hypothetical protein